MRYSVIITFLAILVAMNGISFGYDDGVTSSTYSGTYVDATVDNTTSADGAVPWYSSTDTSTKLWFLRGFANPYGSEATIFEADGASSRVGDAPLLVTTISGLDPYVPYNAYVVLWTPTTNNWDVMAGMKADELTEFNGTTGTVWTNAVEGNRHEYEGLVGLGFANAAGELSVYIDDTSDAERSWYDGLVYSMAFMAYHPTPNDSDINVALDATLTWEAMLDSDNPTQVDPDLVEHVVYLNNDPNLAIAPVSTIAAGQPLQINPVLAANETYYWRVDEVTSTGTVIGAVWTFDTIKTVPDFNPPLGSQPESMAVATGEVAILTAVAGTTDGLGGTMNYQWYKGLPGDYTNLVTGGNSSQLSIDVEVSNEGWYFCQATNDIDSTDSEAAFIQANRLMAHYKFNQSVADETGNSTVVMTDPNFIGGIDGDALELDGVDYADLGLDGYPNNSLPSGCLYSGTVSYWAKTVGTGTVMGTYNDGPGYHTAIHFEIGRSMVRGQDNIKLEASYSSALVADGQWHLVTTTYDSGVAPNTMTVYIDGKAVSTVTQPNEIVHLAWQYPIFIGGYNSRGTGMVDGYVGDLDDMRIYNYPLDAFEVAQLFIDFVPDADPICASRPEFDFTGPEGAPDCKVDLYDFAEVAKEWLVCNIIPLSDCN
ncbi:MAG: hypothetical protein JEZ07_19290 [Phycisphaerae bacterium]|nr:hypothetical protein [Phycisphaerae bacterium]